MSISLLDNVGKKWKGECLCLSKRIEGYLLLLETKEITIRDNLLEVLVKLS